MHTHATTEEDRTPEIVPPISPRAPWRIAEVGSRPGYRLHVRFNDGTEGTVDMARFLGSSRAGVFSTLRDEALFQQVRLKWGVVTWPGDLDLAPDAMYAAIKQRGEWVLY